MGFGQDREETVGNPIQAKILNDLHHRRAEILNRLFNPLDNLPSDNEMMHSKSASSQPDAGDMFWGCIHSNKTMVQSSQSLIQGSHQSPRTARQDVVKVITGQRSVTGNNAENGREGLESATGRQAQIGRNQNAIWPKEFNKSHLDTGSQQSNSKTPTLEEYKFTNPDSSDGIQQRGISSSSDWLMAQISKLGTSHFYPEENHNMTSSAVNPTPESTVSVQRSQISNSYEQTQPMTNPLTTTAFHSRMDPSHWRGSHISSRNRTFLTKNGYDRDRISESSKIKPESCLGHQHNYVGHASRNTSTISNPSDTLAALDTGCGVWSVDGVDDVVWNFTDTTLTSHLSNEEEDLLKEERMNSTEFMLNWLHDIPDEPTPIEPLDQFVSPPRHPALDRSEDDAIIPFDSTPIVSRFGPISRSARSKYKNTEPVQVTANDVMKKMTPVTAVTPLDHPKPTAKAQPSYMSPIPGIETTNSTNTVRWRRPSELENCVQRELSRLEQQALKADTENEFLACELKAVELQISLQTEKNVPQPVPETPILNPELHPAVEVVVPVPIAVPVKTESPHNPPGIWSSFELLKAAYTRGQKIDDLRELLKHVPAGVDHPSGPLTPQEEQFLKDVLGVENSSSVNFPA